MSSLHRTEAPPFLVLAGHPVRWAVLAELAESDCSVAQLVRAVGQPQAVVSYHLGRLRAGGLVSAHRSSFDGRAAYYRVHLDRCGAALAATGAALHPGLGAGDTTVLEATAARRPVLVLFACTGNGARSQIAEALLRARAGDLVDVVSAGSHPKPVHPNAIRAMSERGIDISHARSKSLGEFSGRSFDLVITLCDRVREICPEFDGSSLTSHWSIEDPSRIAGDGRATMPLFRAVVDELESRIQFLVPVILRVAHKEPTHHDR